jgi:hypothetical protein
MGRDEQTNKNKEINKETETPGSGTIEFQS